MPTTTPVSQLDTNDVELGWNPGRVCFGLSRIGYVPTSALCDIIDNSVRAQAKNVHIYIEKEKKAFNDSRKNNIKSYLVIDDGIGMDEKGIQEALKLGADDTQYDEHCLSKFGLGLKSAAFSQGKELQVISSPGEGKFNKFVVSLPAIEAKGAYFGRRSDISGEDKELIAKHLSAGHGTIIRITEVRNVNQPSVKATVDELKYKAGVIYYYFLKDDGTKIFVHEGEAQEEIPPFDVLFTAEAEINGNLNENEWDGRTVQWIQRPKEVLLDSDANVKAQIEATQLVHPPTFNIGEPGAQAKAREKYRIEAGNYGYYVYRNRRLISWAERFDGIIPNDQDFYSFRGRIHIDESADDSFNIDVKKSHLTLSDEATKAIDEFSAEYKGKSKKAWGRAKDKINEIINASANSASNEIAASFEPPQDLPGTPAPTEETEKESQQREKDIEEDMKDRLRKETAQKKAEREGHPVAPAEVAEAEVESTLKGDANPSAKKIFQVPAIADNNLWEPYFDASNGACVRINALHRFARVVYMDNSKNTDLQILFELMMLQFAEAEVYCQTKTHIFPRKDIERMIAEYRRVTSEFLAAMCRQSEEKLPPTDKS